MPLRSEQVVLFTAPGAVIAFVALRPILTGSINLYADRLDQNLWGLDRLVRDADERTSSPRQERFLWPAAWVVPAWHSASGEALYEFGVQPYCELPLQMVSGSYV